MVMVHVAASVSNAIGNLLKSQSFAAGPVVSARCMHQAWRWQNGKCKMPIIGILTLAPEIEVLGISLHSGKRSYVIFLSTGDREAKGRYPKREPTEDLVRTEALLASFDLFFF